MARQAFLYIRTGLRSVTVRYVIRGAIHVLHIIAVIIVTRDNDTLRLSAHERAMRVYMILELRASAREDSASRARYKSQEPARRGCLCYGRDMLRASYRYARLRDVERRARS